MFALDLFNTDHERRLAEGAVDRLEQRRIDDLAMKMDDLVARAKQVKDPAHRAALMKEFQKCKAERESYFKIKDECMGYGSLVGEEEMGEAGIPGNLPADQIPGKEDLLKGKGRQTYEDEMDETNYAPTKAAGRQAVGRTAQVAAAPRAYGVANFQRLVKANMGNRPYVDLEFANPADNIRLDQHGLDLISDYYDGLGTDQAKNHFIYRILPSADEVNTVLKKLGWNGGGAQQQLPLAEKKKFNNQEVDAKDTKVARELRKLRAQYPAAKSDLEAVAHAEIDSTERSQQQLAAIKGANDKQDALLRQLVSLDQEQGREIDGLDKENNSLEKRLAQIQSTNSRLQTAIGRMTGTKKSVRKDAGIPPAQDAGAINLIPNAPADNVEAPPTQKGAAKSSAIGHMAQQISSFPNVAPGIKQPEDNVATELPADQDDDEENYAQQHSSLKGLRPATTAANPDDFKLTAEGKMGEIDAMRQDLEQMSERQFYAAHGISKAAFQQQYRTLLKPAMDEGYQDFNKVEPYEVCLAGKCVKTFDYYEDARRFHDNWKKKLYAQGDKAKADKITLNPVMKEEEQNPAGWGQFPPKQEIKILPPKKLKSGETYQGINDYWRAQGQAPIYKTNEAGSPAQQAAIAIAMKKAGKKPKHVDENDDWDDGDWADDAEQHAVVKKQPPARYPEQVLRAIERNPGMRADIIADYKRKQQQGVAEGGFGRDEEFLNRERNAGLEHETNNIQIYINGRPWKVVPGKGYADSVEERQYLNNMRKWAEKKSAASGKKWTVSLTGANPTVNELSTEKLAQYKKAAGADASAADKAGNIERGNKRFRGIVKATIKQGDNDAKKHKVVDEAETDYSKRRQRERDVDAGKPVAKQRQPKMTDYQKRRAQQKKEMELGEESSTSSEDAERAILNRIMVAHTDLLMKFGPEKVMQAVEEVAYGVGDLDEIGTSDVSAWVHEVKQILGAE